MIMSAEQATEIALAINLVIKLAAQDQSFTLEVIADYFTLPSLMMSPEFVEDNFDKVDDYDGDSSSFITSNMADRTMRKLSEQNAAGKKTYKYNKLLIITIGHQNTLASLEDDGVYVLDEGHHTDDGGHDGGYEDHRGGCDEGSDLVVLSEFMDEDEGSEFVDFEDLVATVLSEAE